MQVASTSFNSNYNCYNGVLDATLKIINEGGEKTSGNTDSRSKFERAIDKVRGIKNLYKGSFVYGISYTAYIAI